MTLVSCIEAELTIKHGTGCSPIQNVVYRNRRELSMWSLVRFGTHGSTFQCGNITQKKKILPQRRRKRSFSITWKFFIPSSNGEMEWNWIRRKRIIAYERSKTNNLVQNTTMQKCLYHDSRLQESDSITPIDYQVHTRARCEEIWRLKQRTCMTISLNEIYWCECQDIILFMIGALCDSFAMRPSGWKLMIHNTKHFASYDLTIERFIPNIMIQAINNQIVDCRFIDLNNMCIYDVGNGIWSKTIIYHMNCTKWVH